MMTALIVYLILAAAFNIFAAGSNVSEQPGVALASIIIAIIDCVFFVYLLRLS